MINQFGNNIAVHSPMENEKAENLIQIPKKRRVKSIDEKIEDIDKKILSKEKNIKLLQKDIAELKEERLELVSKKEYNEAIEIIQACKNNKISVADLINKIDLFIDLIEGE